MFSSSRQRGCADAFENDPPFIRKETVLCVYTQPCVYTTVDLNLDPLLNLDLLPNLVHVSARVYTAAFIYSHWVKRRLVYMHPGSTAILNLVLNLGDIIVPWI